MNRRGKWVSLGVLCSVVGCHLLPDGVLPDFVPPPGDDVQVVVGGIFDTRPYYGDVRSAENADQELADFVMASCGCGDWRVLVLPGDGSASRQFVVRFFSEGEYDPQGDVTMYGVETGEAVGGDIQQALGTMSGRVQLTGQRGIYSATRGENHQDSVEACTLCHIGDDPIWPMPEEHPSFHLDPANCLDCHSVNGA